jgi:hypothetical protein
MSLTPRLTGREASANGIRVDDESRADSAAITRISYKSKALPTFNLGLIKLGARNRTGKVTVEPGAIGPTSSKNIRQSKYSPSNKKGQPNL